MFVTYFTSGAEKGLEKGVKVVIAGMLRGAWTVCLKIDATSSLQKERELALEIEQPLHRRFTQAGHRRLVRKGVGWLSEDLSHTGPPPPRHNDTSSGACRPTCRTYSTTHPPSQPARRSCDSRPWSPINAAASFEDSTTRRWCQFHGSSVRASTTNDAKPSGARPPTTSSPNPSPRQPLEGPLPRVMVCR